jgi:hypothetical protein
MFGGRGDQSELLREAISCYQHGGPFWKMLA